MSSNYGPHFGVRRLSPDAVREARLKTPVSGDKMLLGTAVEQDFSDAGFMKQADDGATLRPGTSGLLIWEDQFFQVGAFGTIDAGQRRDTSELAYANKGKYAQMVSEAGAKFWFKNTAERTTADGEVTYDAIEPVLNLGDGTTWALGDWIGWDGTQWEQVGAADDPQPDEAWFQVTALNDDASYLEATMLR